MKKSQLRNIIKESIKQLMTEQGGSSCPQRNPAGYCRIKMSPCGNNIDPQTGNLYDNSLGGANNGIWSGTRKLLKIGSQSPQVGMYFENPYAQSYCNQGVGINPDGSCNTVWKVEHVCTGPSTGAGHCADICGSYSNPVPCGELDWNTGNCVTPPSGCTQQDFDYNASCGTQWLVPAPGGANSWNTWLQNQWNAFNGNAGCYQFGSIQTQSQNQLTIGLNNQNQPLTQNQISRKQAKSDWAACMQQLCAGGPQNGC